MSFPHPQFMNYTNTTAFIIRLKTTHGASRWSRPTRRGSTGWPLRTLPGSRRPGGWVRTKTSCWGNCEQLQQSARTLPILQILITSNNAWHTYTMICARAQTGFRMNVCFCFQTGSICYGQGEKHFHDKSYVLCPSQSEDQPSPEGSHTKGPISDGSALFLGGLNSNKNRIKEITRSIVGSCWYWEKKRGILIGKTFFVFSRNWTDCNVVSIYKSISNILYLETDNKYLNV